MLEEDAAASQGTTEYYARNIGLAKHGSNSTYSFLVSGREEKGSQTRVLNTFFVHGAKVLSQTGYLDEKYGEFALSLSCDLKSADVTADDLIIELRRFKFVHTVESQNMRNRFFDRHLFPVTMMDTVRVIALDSDLFSQIGEKLGENKQGRLDLRDLAKSYAIRVVERSRQLEGKRAVLINIQENSLAYFRAIGLGTIRMQSDSRVESVIIQDPPTNKSGKAAGNPLIHGIAIGLVEALKLKRTHLSREAYDEANRLLTLTLVEASSDELPSSQDATEETESPATQRFAVVPLSEITRTSSEVGVNDSGYDDPQFFNEASYRDLE